MAVEGFGMNKLQYVFFPLLVIELQLSIIEYSN
jgi:hypothetical protein